MKKMCFLIEKNDFISVLSSLLDFIIQIFLTQKTGENQSI